MHASARKPTRLVTISLVAVSLLTVVAACGSDEIGHSPVRTGYATINYGAIITGCAIKRHLIPKKKLHESVPLSDWYRDGQVEDNPSFSSWWFSHHASTFIHGKSLRTWAQNSKKQGRLPAKICGFTAMPSPLPTKRFPSSS